MKINLVSTKYYDFNKTNVEVFGKRGFGPLSARKTIGLLIKQIHEELPANLIHHAKKRGMVIRNEDWTEYYLLSKQEINKYVDVKIPLSCDWILIRKSFLVTPKYLKFKENLREVFRHVIG